VKFKPGAAEKFSGVVEDRLVRAARHLADVLGALRWAK
jgi:hypothetical protein